MVLFEEEQRFRQTWLWFIIAATAIGSISYLTYIQKFNAVMALVPIFGFTYALFDFARLRTKVVEDEVQIKFFPFHLSNRKIKFGEIEEFGAEDYSPIREFGGWGLRWRPGKRAYNVSGNKGVRITKKNGKQVIIGTQRPEDFEAAIQEAMN